MNSQLRAQADTNLQALSRITYSGRGFVMGRLISGEAVFVYWLTGRDPKTSKNRVFLQERDMVRTEIADPSLLPEGFNTDLILYPALMTAHGYHVVSNGKQTQVVHRAGIGTSLDRLLIGDYQYEPDSPIFTPRITGMYVSPQAMGVHHEYHLFQISMLRKSPFGDDCQRFLWQYRDIAPGFGYSINTYMDDGKPPALFEGEPRLMPLQDDPRGILEQYWNILDASTRVAVAVKFVQHTGESVVYVRNEKELVTSAPAD